MASEIDQCRFMNGQVYAFRRFERDRRGDVLHIDHVHGGDRGLVFQIGRRVDGADLRRGVLVFVAVIIAGDPPGGVVAGQLEFRQLLLHQQTHIRSGRFGEGVAEAEAVVEDPEGEQQRFGVGHLQRDGQLVVAVADLRNLAPDRLPSLVEGGRFIGFYLEFILQIQALQNKTQFGFADQYRFTDSMMYSGRFLISL